MFLWHLSFYKFGLNNFHRLYKYDTILKSAFLKAICIHPQQESAMKHRNPTRQHALLALLASLSLSGCQWDSVQYDSYIAAFGESGAGGFDTCENIEYILLRDTTTKYENNDNTENDNDSDDANKESNYIKLYRSTCCITNEDGSCTLRENALEINKYCIAFQFNKCPLTASRCMTEIVTIQTINETGQNTKRDDLQFYCAEAVCPDNTIECSVQFTWGNRPEESMNIFSCLNQDEDKLCGATCPKEGIQISVDSFDNISKITNYYQYLKEENKGINCQSNNKTCKRFQDSPETPAEYICECPENKIECDGKCIDPQTDTNYCGAKGMCNITFEDNSDASGDPNYAGAKCGENFRCLEGVCCNADNNKCTQEKKCMNGYKYCEGSNEDNRRQISVCLSTAVSENYHTWNALGFMTPKDPNSDISNDINYNNFGCECKSNYHNKDKIDANGCEAAISVTECGILNNKDFPIVNCLKHYNAKSAKCIEENGTPKCQEIKCHDGFNYDPKTQRCENNNLCCGTNCTNCIEEQKICQEEACIINPCPLNTYSCFNNFKCLSKEELEEVHISIDTNTLECKCTDGYMYLEENCYPTPQKACELSSEKNKYCFGQCLNETQQKEAHIISDSTSCDCEEGYEKVLFGMVEVNNPTPPDTNTNIDNSIPGYCKKTESSNHTPYSCNGKNCYEIFPYANPKDVKCKKDDKDKEGTKYSCYFDKCLDGYFLYTPKDTSKPNKCLRKGYYFDNDCVAYCGDCKDGETCNIYSNWSYRCYAASCD